MSARNVLHAIPDATLFFAVTDTRKKKSWLDICAGGVTQDSAPPSEGGLLSDWKVFSGDNCVKSILKRSRFADIDVGAITRVLERFG